MSDKKHGLGRGLSALLGDATRIADSAAADGQSAGIQSIAIARIRPNPTQPRKHFDEDSLAELAESRCGSTGGLGALGSRAACTKPPLLPVSVDSCRSSWSKLF